MIYEEKPPENATAHQSEEGSPVAEDMPTNPADAATLIEELDLEQQLAEPELTSAESLSSPADAEEIPTAAADEGQQLLLESLMQEVESLKAQLEASNSQSEAFKAQFSRLSADFDNFRRRTQKEKEELEQQIKCNTITELLPVVDNFERARSHLNPQTDSAQTIHKSYQSVYKQLVECLKRIGVSPMRPEGKEFDPNLHEAVMRQPTDEYPEGTVMEELVRGYFLGEKVLRHAMVKVAAAIEPVVTSEESNQDSIES